jgi:hypothetical protein
MAVVQKTPAPSGFQWYKTGLFRIADVAPKYDLHSEHPNSVTQRSVLECGINQGVCQGAALAPCTGVRTADSCT